MFIRIKHIKKNSRIYSYAYLVESKWRKRLKGKKGARQKVKNYLGKVYRLEKKAENDFFTYYNISNSEDYLKNNSKNKIINNLIKLELINHGFKEDNNLLVNNDLTFNQSSRQFIGADGEPKKKVLALNNGFLCRETINRLLKANFFGTEEEVGYKLAKAFVESGINIPKDIFVGIFEKVLKD